MLSGKKNIINFVLQTMDHSVYHHPAFSCPSELWTGVLRRDRSKNIFTVITVGCAAQRSAVQRACARVSYFSAARKTPDAQSALNSGSQESRK